MPEQGTIAEGEGQAPMEIGQWQSQEFFSEGAGIFVRGGVR